MAVVSRFFMCEQKKIMRGIIFLTCLPAGTVPAAELPEKCVFRCGEEWNARKRPIRGSQFYGCPAWVDKIRIAPDAGIRRRAGTPAATV